MRTRLTDAFGIQHPIICAPMALITGGRLAAAVSSAGGLGIVGGLFVARLIASLLFGVAPTDVPTFISVGIVLFMAALAASYVPALRATKVDPMVALRYE